MAIRNSHFSLQEYLNVVVVVVSILEITYSGLEKGLVERLGITFTSNGKREFLPRDQVSPLLVVHCSLFLHIN